MSWRETRRRLNATAQRFVDAGLAPFADREGNVILSGFWRSGTTWLHRSLADAIRAKTVFEPYDPRAYRWRDPARLEALFPGLPSATWEYLQGYLPFAEGDLSDRPSLRAHLQRAVRASSAGIWARKIRSGVTECLRRRTVVKFTRGALSLAAVQRALGVPVVHVYRDPRAIVASLERKGWKWYLEFSLVDQLLRPEDGRAEWFGRFEDEIEEWESRGRAARIVAYWALTERYLRESVTPGVAPFVFLSYERMVFEGSDLLPEVLEGLGLERFADGDVGRLLNRPSRTTDSERRGEDPRKRLDSWRKELDPALADLAAEIVAAAGAGDLIEGR